MEVKLLNVLKLRLAEYGLCTSNVSYYQYDLGVKGECQVY